MRLSNSYNSWATGGPISSSSACAVSVASTAMRNGARMTPCGQLRPCALPPLHSGRWVSQHNPPCRTALPPLAVINFGQAALRAGKARKVCAAAFNKGDAGFGNGSGGAVQQLQQQLEVLNAEAKDVAAQLKDAWADWRKNPDDPVVENIVQGLQAEEASLDEMRKALEAKLPGAGAGAGTVVASASGAGMLLTRREAIRHPLYTVAYTHIVSSSTTPASSEEVVVKVERWKGFNSGAKRLITALPDSTRMYEPPRAAAEPSSGKRETRILVRDTSFAFVQQLGGHAGLPVIRYCWIPKDEEGGQSVRFQSTMEEGWVWKDPAGRLQLVVAVEAKHAFSRPFESGWKFVELYNMSQAEAEKAEVQTQRTSVRKQVQQLLGYMRKEQVPYGVLYSDVGYWFFFDDAVKKVLKVSQCYPPMQMPPVTLTAAILYMGHLAVKAATGAGSQSPGNGGKRAGGGSARDGGSGQSAGSSGMSSRGSMGGASGAGVGNSVGDEGGDGYRPSACFGPWTDCRAMLFHPSASSATSPSAEVAPLLATTTVSAAAQQPGAQTAAGAAAAGAQAVAGAQPATGTQEGVLCSLQLGLMVSRGSTGAVYVARLPGNPNYPELFAVKVAQPCPDSRGSAASQRGAVRRLLHELDVYQGPLAGLQGVAVPRVLGYGVLELGSQSERRPFIALPLLGPSLHDATQTLLPEQEQAILAALDQLHCAGVLHGDVRSANIVLPPSDGGDGSDGSDGHSSQPLWVDFSHAELFDPAHKQALMNSTETYENSTETYETQMRLERGLCEEMLQSLEQADPEDSSPASPALPRLHSYLGVAPAASPA